MLSSSTIVVRKWRCVVSVDDLNYGVQDVAFEGKVLNWYGTYDQIAKKYIDDLSYAYVYYEFLDATSLTAITLRVKSLHIHVHEQLLQKRFHVKIENFGIKAKSQRGFEKGEMPILIIIEFTTIV
jgi:hypothetical protein